MTNLIRIAFAVSAMFIMALIATGAAAMSTGDPGSDRKSSSVPALSPLAIPPSGPAVDDDDDDEEDEDWNPKGFPGAVSEVLPNSPYVILAKNDDDDEDDDDDYPHLVKEIGISGSLPAFTASRHVRTDAQSFEDDETEDDDDPGDDDDGRI